MGDGILLRPVHLCQGELAAEAVGNEQGVVAEAVLADQLMPDAALDSAARNGLAPLLVDEHQGAHEARRTLGVGHALQFGE